MSIAAGVGRCWTAFRRITTLDANGPGNRPEDGLLSRVKIEETQFQEWFTHNGAHQTKKKSLDEKLRDAPHIHNVVVDLLDRLDDCLSRILPLEAALLSSDSGFIHQFFAGGEDEPSGSCSSETEISPVEAATQIVDRLCLSVSRTISTLLRLSVSFVNSVPLERYRKAATIDMLDWERRDEEYVELKFPTIKDFLKDRIVRAILARRRFLAYCKQYHFKLAQGFAYEVDETGLTGDVAEVVEDGTETTVSGLPEIDKRGEGSPSDQPERREEDQRSVTSYSSDSGDSSRPRFPSPPEDLGRRPFPCPYCYLYIDPSTKRDWRRHVVSDLQPFVCTFEGCSESEKLYGSLHEWYSHELHHHRKAWCCPKGCDDSFGSLHDLDNHMRKTHPAAHAGPLRSALIRSSPRNLFVDYSSACPFCGEIIKSSRLVRKHIGDHQLETALWASRFYYSGQDDPDGSETESIHEEDEVPAVASATRPGVENTSSEGDEVPAVASSTRGEMENTSSERLKHEKTLHRHNIWILARAVLPVTGPLKLGALMLSPFDVNNLVEPDVSLGTKEYIISRTVKNDFSHLTQSTKTRTLHILANFLQVTFGVDVESSSSSSFSLTSAEVTILQFEPSLDYVKKMVELLLQTAPQGYLLRPFRKYYIVTGLQIAKNLQIEHITTESFGINRSGIIPNVDPGQSISLKREESKMKEINEMANDGIFAYSLNEIRMMGLSSRISQRRFTKGTFTL